MPSRKPKKTFSTSERIFTAEELGVEPFASQAGQAEKRLLARALAAHRSRPIQVRRNLLCDGAAKVRTECTEEDVTLATRVDAVHSIDDLSTHRRPRGLKLASRFRNTGERGARFALERTHPARMYALLFEAAADASATRIAFQLARSVRVE